MWLTFGQRVQTPYRRQGEHRMKLHANARLSVKGRELLVDRILTQGWSLAQAAEAAGVSDRTAFKWVARFRAEGEQGLLDRPSAPKSSPARTPDGRGRFRERSGLFRSRKKRPGQRRSRVSTRNGSDGDLALPARPSLLLGGAVYVFA